VATGAAWLKGRSSQEERKKNILTRKGKKERKTYLTHTGPLMEGVDGTVGNSLAEEKECAKPGKCARGQSFC
jgi:hypothetical protein